MGFRHSRRARESLDQAAPLFSPQMAGHAGVNRDRAILVPPQIDDLRAFTRARVLLAFDYDGTLSPIAPTPERARLPQATRRLLIRVAQHYPMAVISGRA